MRLQPPRFTVDLPGMKSAGFGLATIFVCAAHGQPARQTIIEQQMRENVVTIEIRSGSVQSIPFSLHPQTAASDRIYIRTPKQSVDLGLRLPNGVFVTPRSARASGLRWTQGSGVWVIGLCEGADRWDIITLPPGSLPGLYTIEAKLPATAPLANLCATSFTLGKLSVEELQARSVGDWVGTDRQNYQVGDLVRISTPVLEDGRPVRGAKVEAVIFYAEGMSLGSEAGRIALKDESGHGDYMGTFQPSKPAHFIVQVTVSGRNQTQAGDFRVNPSSGALISAALTTALGLPQGVLRFKIASAGRYKITPSLRASNGVTYSTPIEVDLTAGEQEVIWPVSRKGLDVLGANQPPFDLGFTSSDGTQPLRPAQTSSAAGSRTMVGGSPNSLCLIGMRPHRMPRSMAVP